MCHAVVLAPIYFAYEIFAALCVNADAGLWNERLGGVFAIRLFDVPRPWRAGLDFGNQPLGAAQASTA